MNVFGHGALAQGGVGGKIVHVTNLNDSGPGSLREVVDFEGPRHVIFDVAGYIDLQTSLRILSPHITIAGETAPMPGITLRKAFDVNYLASLGGCIKIGRMAYGNPKKYVDVHDVIIRHLRFRHGDGRLGHSAGLAIHGGHDIVIDHCSLSWSPDNLMLIWLTLNDPPIYNVTIQRCLFAEPFKGHATALAIHGYHDWEEKRLNVTYKDISKVSVHHNFFTNSSHRMPMTRTGGTEIINNLMYNHDYRTFQPQADDLSDFRNNYIRCGPQQPAEAFLCLAHQWMYQLVRHDCPFPASLYLEGNIVEDINTATEDDWSNISQWIDCFHDAVLDPIHRRRLPLLAAPVPVPIRSATDIVDDILADCGATEPARDTIDARLVAEYENGTGITTYVESVEDAGGWP